MILSLLFGLVFSFIGFVNTFWGNDPYYGISVFSISILFYLPALNCVVKKISPKSLNIIKIILGFLILWISLGVGELFDKIALMIENFPSPFITSRLL
tara:strand:+ start:1099 stop:1392 length:294 start_codon:yes stop_codon:yes gene_type:complete